MGTPITPPAPVPKGRSLARRAWRGTKRLLLYSLLLVVGAITLYLLAAYSFTYSTGERAGYVQKFSKKGWLCKTWEGELAMATMPGVMPETFAFTLHDDNVAAEINKSMGQRVTLSYEQKVGLPSCFGDTAYWVTHVRPIEAAK
jgi:hypothetical protein